MILDEHTPCPACPQVVRDFFVATRRLFNATVANLPGPPPVEYDDFVAAHEALRPWVDAHHANQLHSHSITLEDARAPQLTVVAVDHEGSQR